MFVVKYKKKKMYKLNKNSLTSRFYSWVWEEDVTEFKNMCPYFWGYVLTILLLPIILFVKGLMCLYDRLFSKIPVKSPIKEKHVDKILDAVDKVASYRSFWDYVGKFFKWLFFGALLIVAVCASVMFVILLIHDPINMLAAIGVVAIFFLVIWLSIWLLFEKNLASKIWSFFKLVGNMAYGLYKNMCPLIQWENH